MAATKTAANSRLKLYKKIAELQQKAPIIHKDTKGYGYTYADLTTIFKVINPLLKEFKLGFTQGCIYNEITNSNIITTDVFCCETGEVISSSMKIDESVELKGMNHYQVLGSAITYFKRYQISAMLGLITDKDIDASGEQPHNKVVKKTEVATKEDATKLTDDRFKKALDAVKNEKTREAALASISKFSLTPKQLKEFTEVKKSLK